MIKHGEIGALEDSKTTTELVVRSVLNGPSILNVSESSILTDNSPKHKELTLLIGKYFKLLTLVLTLDINKCLIKLDDVEKKFLYVMQ